MNSWIGVGIAILVACVIAYAATNCHKLGFLTFCT